MRSNLEDNVAKRLRAQAISFSTVEATLTGPYRISPTIESISPSNPGQGGATFHFLNPGGTDRDVFLPALHPGGGQFYIISNQGPTGTLRVRDAGGVLLKTIDVGANLLCVSSILTWHTLPLSPSGSTGVISTDGPVDATKLAGFKDTTGLVIRAVAPGAGLDLSNGTDLKLDQDLISLAAVTQVDAFFYRKAGSPPTWVPVVVGAGLTFNASSGQLTATSVPLSDGDRGDITLSGGGTIWTINNAAVTNAKLANMPTANFKARITAATGAPEDITGTQATTLLNIFTSALKGLAPASGGGTTNFLRADGIWTTPPGGGGGSSITISDTPPGSPTAGSLWWESDTGILWIYYVETGTGSPSSQWVVAAGGGAAAVSPGTLVQIQRQDVSSAVASVDFTSGIDATYDEYEFHIFNIKPSADDAIALRVSFDAGATWKTDATYNYSYRVQVTSGTPADVGGTGQPVGWLGASQASGAAAQSFSGIVRFWRPSGGTQNKTFMFDVTGFNQAAFGGFRAEGYCAYTGAQTAINGVRFLCQGGANFTQGTFILYGIKK